jgi:uncharacterized protein YbjT (DUF2867 family)
MSGSLDDRAVLVLAATDYDFVVVGSQIEGQSKVYRNPNIHPDLVCAALRRIADRFEQAK